MTPPHPTNQVGASAPRAAMRARAPKRGTAMGDAHARRILDGLPVPVLSLVVPDAPGEQTRVAWINRAAEDVMGRSAEDLGREPASLWGHVHAEDVTSLRAWLAAPTPQPLCQAIRFVTREGRLRRYELVAQQRADDTFPGCTAIDVVLHDVSSRQALEEAVQDREDQLHALAESSRDVVFHLRLHPRLTIAWTNDAAPNLFGISPAELNEDATAVFRTVFPDHRDRLRDALQSAVGGPTSVVFDINRHGERVTVEMELRPVRSAGQTALLAVGRRLPDAAVAPSVGAPASQVARPSALTTGAPEQTATPAAPELDGGLVRIDVAKLLRHVVKTAGITGRTIELQAQRAPLVTDLPVLQAAVDALIRNVGDHTPQGANIRVVVAKAMAGVLVSVADDGPGWSAAADLATNDKGVVDVADLVAHGHGGAGMAALAAAAERHTGRAAMQSLPGDGTTVRLLLHDAVPVAEPSLALAPPQDIVLDAPRPSQAPGHAPAFRDEPDDSLAPRFLEVGA